MPIVGLTDMSEADVGTPRKRRVADAGLLRLYAVEHLTMQQIASVAGVSKQRVHQLLQRMGITGQDGGIYARSRETRACAHCGAKAQVPRTAARHTRHYYCNETCRLAALHPVVHCSHCGAAVRRNRFSLRRAYQSYCNVTCRTAGQKAFQRLPMPPLHDQSSRASVIARKIVRARFPLKPEHVVHHIDKDNTNNRLENLMVFASIGDHNRWHRQGGPASGVRPLYVGSADSVLT